MTAYPRDVADDWRSRAVCRDVDPEVFFADDSVLEAKATCAGCPVAAQCLRHALDLDERFGVWGGLARGERARLRPDGASGRRLEPALPGFACRDARGTRKGYDRHSRAKESACRACREASRAETALRRLEERAAADAPRPRAASS